MKARFLAFSLLLTSAAINLLAVYWSVGITLTIGATTLILFVAFLSYLQSVEAYEQHTIRALRRKEAPRGPLHSEIQSLLLSQRQSQTEAEQKISEANQAEAAAHAVLERSRVAVATINHTGVITYVNPSFHRIFRLSRKPEGHRPIEVVPVAEAHDLTQGALTGKEDDCHVAYGALDLHVGARPLTGGGAVLWAEDITTIIQAQRSRQDFVANVSHELRTPAASIRGYAETILLDADLLPPQFLPLVEAVERNARRLSELFEDLLKLHRVQGRRRQLPLKSMPLKPLLTNAVASAEELASRRDQSFTLTCDEELVGWVHPEALQTIIANLAANATNYTPHGGSIQIIAQQSNDRVCIDVIDNGVGIPAAHHERVFERFYRVQQSTEKPVVGTGLGLAIVRHYALASRAELTLQSEIGQGSTFRVCLPTNA